jgi:polynucleotide 5'-kinase involved in rRNA processing
LLKRRRLKGQVEWGGRGSFVVLRSAMLRACCKEPGMSTDVLRYLRPPVAETTGREGELALLLREHHEAKSTGTARFVFVRGPRGVGKSHLVAQLAQALAL